MQSNVPSVMEKVEREAADSHLHMSVAIAKDQVKKHAPFVTVKVINDPFLLSATLSTSARSLFTFANTFKNHLIFLQPNDG